MDFYEVLTCEDPDIVAVLIPDSDSSRNLVRSQDPSSLAYRLRGGPGNELKIMSRPGSTSHSTEPVLALRATENSYSIGSSSDCSLQLPWGTWGGFSAVALHIWLSSEEPSVSIRSNDDQVLLNRTAIGSETMNIVQETSIQMNDIFLKLTPIRTLLSNRLAHDGSHRALGVAVSEPDLSLIRPSSPLGAQQQKASSLDRFRGVPVDEGAQGTVYNYRCPKTGQDLTAKVMCYLDPSNPRAERKAYYMKREVLVSPQIAEHEHLLKVLEIFEYPEGYAIIMPLYAEGSLYTAVRNYGSLIRNNAKVVISQVLRALQCLHGQSILHRDVKPPNILIASRDPLCTKLCDYGHASDFQPISHSFVGSPAFVAPEVYGASIEHPYTGQVDIYSTGMVLLWLLDVKLPLETPRSRNHWNLRIGRTLSAQLNRVHDSDYREALEAARRMVSFSPEDRPTLVECLDLPWLEQIDSPRPSNERPAAADVDLNPPEAVMKSPAPPYMGPLYHGPRYAPWFMRPVATLPRAPRYAALTGRGPQPVQMPSQIPWVFPPSGSKTSEDSEASTAVLSARKRPRLVAATSSGNDKGSLPQRKKRKTADVQAVTGQQTTATAAAPALAKASVPAQVSTRRTRTNRGRRGRTRHRPQVANVLSSLGEQSFTPGRSDLLP